MIYPSMHCEEIARDTAIENLNLTSQSFDAQLDAPIAQLHAASGYPVSLLSIVSQNRQYFKVADGTHRRQTHRNYSFCGHAILEDEDVFSVEDARADPRFHDNPLVTGDAQLRSYLGAVVRNKQQLPLGTVCLLNTKSEKPASATVHQLLDTKRQIESILHSREEAAGGRHSVGAPPVSMAALESIVKNHFCTANENNELVMSQHRSTIGFTFVRVTPGRTHTKFSPGLPLTKLHQEVDAIFRSHLLREGDVCFSIGENEWFIGLSRTSAAGALKHLNKLPVIIEYMLRKRLNSLPALTIGGCTAPVSDNDPADVDRFISEQLQMARATYTESGHGDIVIDALV